MRPFFALTIAFAALLPARRAAAWCQSTNFTIPAGSCAQRCVTEADVPEGRTLLFLQWTRPCLEWVLHERGARDLSRLEVEQVFTRSFERWTSVTCDGRPVGFDVRFDPRPGRCDVTEYVIAEGNANQMIFVPEWTARDHDAMAFALTTTWFSTRTGEIFDADMELNEEQWGWAICPPEGCTDGRVDLENTVVHELGHFFGLAHTPESDEATMWACADEGETLKRDLEADDVEGICTIYGPGELGATCDHTPRGGFDATCSTARSGCGCAAPGLPTSSAGALASGGVLALVLTWRRRRGARG
ncbi:MAG: M10 family metallopeptidase domain-containing protein [Myxococcota bacterium]|jgi:hypothetical protein|nr:M10 family metallopeptidase domain-containing protein [Myxococcota bacterium]